METNQIEQLKAVEAFMKRQQTWFVVALNLDNKSLEIVSREYGNVGAGQPGEKDIREARRLYACLRQEFPELNFIGSITDEWVSIEVDAGPKRYFADEIALMLSKVNFYQQMIANGVELTLNIDNGPILRTGTVESASWETADGKFSVGLMSRHKGLEFFVSDHSRVKTTEPLTKDDLTTRLDHFIGQLAEMVSGPKSQPKKNSFGL